MPSDVRCIFSKYWQKMDDVLHTLYRDETVYTEDNSYFYVAVELISLKEPDRRNYVNSIRTALSVDRIWNL